MLESLSAAAEFRIFSFCGSYLYSGHIFAMTLWILEPRFFRWVWHDCTTLAAVFRKLDSCCITNCVTFPNEPENVSCLFVAGSMIYPCLPFSSASSSLV